MRRPWVAAAIAVAVLVSACTRVSDGLPMAGPDTQGSVSGPVTDSAAPTTSRSPATSAAPPDDPDYPVPGVVETTQVRQPCDPDSSNPVSVVAEVSDPEAPTATVGVPDGWSMASGGTDPEGARMQGPGGMWATVTIAPTRLDPAAAFRQYEDDRTAGASISSLSLLPAVMCGYSGQRLIGVLSDGEETVEYEDRIVHVPGPTQDYLIAVRVEAASGTAGFDEAASQLTEDFGIGLP